MENTKWLKNGVRICVTVAILVILAGGIYFNLNESILSQKESRTASENELIVESGAVLNEEKGYVKQTVSSVKADTRKVFRVVEVIPHEACSIFPYLVEWQNEEEYDKNVPIGYEGLLWCSAHTGNVQMFSGKETPADQSNPYVFIKGAIKRNYLSEYGTNLGDRNSGLWYREAEAGAAGMVTKNGYFEFVGAGKGTYYVPVSYVAERDTDRGIHTQIRVIPRKGSEAPKGDLYVSDPAYYWPKDQNIAKPAYLSKPIRSQTDNNYNCTFKPDRTGSYRVNTEGLRKKTEKDTAQGRAAEEDAEYDYFLTVAEEEENWAAGFSYFKNGNYSIDVSGIELSEEGIYVRIEDDKRMDGYESEEQGIAKGYFRLYEREDGISPRYTVPFQRASGKTGFYCANQPDSWQNAECFFQYAGSGKGQYDAVFLYGGVNGEQGYTAELSSVSDKQGKYVLTSTVESDKKPVYKESGSASLPRDYAKVITNISYLDQVNWAGADSQGQNGVTMGGQNGTSPSSEYGGWVFHEVTNSSEMKMTRLNAVHKKLEGQNSNTESYFTRGDRIYVTNQVRRNRYYCRDGFANNEWFKLLCYSNNPNNQELPYSQMVNGIGYDFKKTPGENLALPAAKNLIKDFDAKYRLEIIQRKPEQLTPEEVRSADLIYISTGQGVEGMAQSWKYISEARVAVGKPALEDENVKSDGNYTFTTDIRTDTLFAIYDECIYDRRVALMVNSNVPGGLPASPATTNLNKMGFLMTWFREAKNFAYFMPWHSEFIPNYSRIDQGSGSVSAYKCVNNEHRHAGLYNYEHNGETPKNVWDKEYFTVLRENGNKVYEYDDSGHNSVGSVYGDECKYLTDYYGVKAFKPGEVRNIWEIINNRDRAELVVGIQNASLSAEATPRWIIYADEFNPQSFDVTYKIWLEGGKIGSTPSPLRDTKLFFDDNDNNVLDMGEESYIMGGQVYDIKYTKNVRNGFAEGGSYDPTIPLDASKRMRKLVVEAADSRGRTAQDEVWIIIREAFFLN